MDVAEQSKLFVGRDKELTWVRRELYGWTVPTGVPPILLLHGPEGVGKTALLEYFLDSYTGKGGSLHTANFIWTAKGRANSLPQFAQGLLHSCQTCLGELEERRSLLNITVQKGGKEFPVDNTAASPEMYTIHGSAREPPMASPMPGQGKEGMLADHFVEALVRWLGLQESHSPIGLEALFRCLFVFDAFETYPTPFKSWLGQYLFPALERERPMAAFSVILTGRKSWEEGAQSDYWEAHPASFLQYPLGPLGMHECRRWLEKMGLKGSLVDLLFEETEGYPGRIVQLLKEKDALVKRLRTPRDPNDPLALYNAQERRWLHAAAMRESVTLEMLQVLLGRVEGLQAFGWLVRNSRICRVEQKEDGDHHIALSRDIRDHILQQVTAKVPSRHREFLERVQLVASVHAKVESRDHRTYLRRLTPIQPFNKTVIQEIFQHEQGSAEVSQ